MRCTYSTVSSRVELYYLRGDCAHEQQHSDGLSRYTDKRSFRQCLLRVRQLFVLYPLRTRWCDGLTSE